MSVLSPEGVSRHPAAIPKPALAFGYAGLLPMVALSGIAFWGPPPAAELAIVFASLYATLILTFLGGVWWAMSVSLGEDSRLPVLLSLGIAPVLAAWPLALWPGPKALMVLAALHVFALGIDTLITTQVQMPDWWMYLRCRLSFGMASLCVLIMMAS
jgi:hypothetical protein